ncbi:hypothetical protein NO559_09855 [Dasania sp. GY-MA-18]|uniref:Uncharacterized protein n=1 Tax=Dasania phycosphaerae TaxID=2950436 RepID=A0A9J6RM23_9GAMM|nr:MULTISPECIES: hypothetical protein [Dasania]MCR8923076.1 hypothetical protein [Dasania sp. GY-MA-18]MCZ0865508.1 hypothetical protein [Dasania phycosphaerae]MCZ0869233.1 hypothetical protein [Dasania phycosphaerae]
MPPISNVVELERFRSPNPAMTEQEQIDEIGASAFLLLRDRAEAHNLSVKKVIAEHMLGLAMVIESVEGADVVRQLLADIENKLTR